MSKVIGVISVIKNTVMFKLPSIQEEIDRIVTYASLARKEGMLALESKVEEASDPFLSKGIRMVIDGIPKETIREILRIELDYVDHRHRIGKAILEYMGGAAPAFGMIGTLIGLVAMLQTLDDPSKIGGGMAVALLTSFYGALLANLVFIPLAGKLDARSKEEMLVREIMAEGIIAIQAGDPPITVEEKLKSFVSEGMRKKMEVAV
jgi:chemotaxis protein MotA